MASEIAAFSMVVTITETATIVDDEGTGRDLAHTNTFTLSNVAKIVRNQVSISTTETGLMSFATNNVTVTGGTPFTTGYACGHFDEDKVKFIRITNKDDTNFVKLTFKNQSDDEFQVIVDKWQSYFYNAFDDTGLVGTMHAEDGAPLAGALATLEDITAQADTGTVDLEVFVALTA